MTRAASVKTLARFQRAAAKYHGTVISADWESWGAEKDKGGIEGGWGVEIKWRTGRNTSIGLTTAEALADIEYNGQESLKWLRKPDLTIPTTEAQWRELVRILYQDTQSLMALEERATALKDGDIKQAWAIIRDLRAGDAERLTKALAR